MVIVDCVLGTQVVEGSKVDDVIVHIGPLLDDLSYLEQAYFLGNQDGAEFGKLILVNDEEEFQLPLTSSDPDEKARLGDYFLRNASTITVVQMPADPAQQTGSDSVTLPLIAHASEMAAIQAMNESSSSA